MSQNKITKIDLVESIFSETNIEKKVIQEVVDSLFDKVKESLKAGSAIELRGFGTFDLNQRKGRANARNPKTGEIVSVKPHMVAIFRPGKELKTSVWNFEREK